MPRVKRGVTKQRRHKKLLALAKGHRASRHKLFRRAKESVIKALVYAYRHRRERKGDFRRLWILRISAAAKSNGISYSKFINGTKEHNLGLNRKMLAEMAVSDPKAFSDLVSRVREPAEVA